MIMNREIKFRGKSKKTRKWLYGYLGEAKFSILDYFYTDKVIFDNVLSFNTDNSAYVVKDLSVEEETIVCLWRKKPSVSLPDCVTRTEMIYMKGI